jgi:transcription antitermination protein NusB
MSLHARESLRRKHCSRMAAVQALYSHAMSEHKPSAEKLFTQLVTQWKESAGVDEEWPAQDKPEQSLLRDVIEGCLEHLESIDTHLQEVIKDNWRSERMDPVLIAILRCAVYELAYRAERKTAVIIDEYVSIASGYFDGQELGFVHSALQQLLPHLRPQPAA